MIHFSNTLNFLPAYSLGGLIANRIADLSALKDARIIGLCGNSGMPKLELRKLVDTLGKDRVAENSEELDEMYRKVH